MAEETRNICQPVLMAKLFQFRTKFTTVFYEYGVFVIRPNYNLSIKLGTIHFISRTKRGGINWKMKPRYGDTKDQYFHCPTGGLPSSNQIDRFFRGPAHLYNNHRQLKVKNKKRFPQRER